MYRSLLYQLLEAMPGLAPAMGQCGERSRNASWPLAEMEDMLIKAVQALDSNAVTCYIDALDECDDEEARKMIEHFETLGKCAVKAGTEFRVLLSSRHYPHIILDDCLELTLEGQEGHEDDIAEYIRCKLKIGKGRLGLEIQDEIRKRACGVFLWVVLVIRILNEYDARGKTHLLRDRLAAIPSGLSELFEEILQQGTHEVNDTLLTFLWILFAQRPLRREELYFAVITNASDDAIEKWGEDEIPPDVMDRYLLDASKGLAEMTKGMHPTVQFIHESVKDYLLDEGLSTIQPGLREDLVTQSHERLRDCCIRYLENSEAALLPERHIGIKRLVGTGPFWSSTTATYPFLDYAVVGVIYHADFAHSPSRSQVEFVAGFPHRFWRRYYNLCYEFKEICVEQQSLYTFVLMKAQNLATIDIQRLSCKVENRLIGGRHRTLLTAAITQGDTSMMKLLLEHGADPNDVSRPQASSCLPLAIAGKNPTMVRTLLEHGAGPTCLVVEFGHHTSTFVESLHYALDQYHCDQRVIECILSRAPYSLMTHWPEVLTETLLTTRSRGYRSTEESLLERMKILVNDLTNSKASATVEGLGEVFVAACGHGDLAIVKVLIEYNILQASNKTARAFTAAVYNKCAEVIRYLLDSGVAVDLELDAFGSTALVIASQRGYVEIVRLLLNHEDRDSRWGIALHSAALNGQASTVKMLLDAGVNPNIHGNYPKIEYASKHWSQWGTPLHMAVRYGSVETARVLLEHADTDPNALDWWGDHAICVACKWGHFDCVELLLEKNIPIEDLDSAAAIAAEEDYPEIMDMLLVKGATPPSGYERSPNSGSSDGSSSANSFLLSG